MNETLHAAFLIIYFVNDEGERTLQEIPELENSTENIAGEEGFAEWMRQEVEPYLKEHDKEGDFSGKDGAKVHYHCYRLPETQRCIVISHGFCEFAEKYNEVVYYFLRAGYSVYLPEHRGHGNSQRYVSDDQMIHVDDYADYVEDFALFVKNVVVPCERERYLFAHSMGGAIGILTLEQYPELFRAAVLSAPMCGIRTGIFPMWMADVIATLCCLCGRGTHYALGQSGFCDTPQFEGSSCVSKERYHYIFEKRIENRQCRTSGGSYAWVHAGIGACRRLMKRKNLAKIDVPVLLFGAGREHMVINRKIRQFAERTRRTRLIWMPESRHEIFNADEASRRSYYKEIFAFFGGEILKSPKGE